FITVSPISQISPLIIGLIGLCWMAYASINIVFKDQLLELKQQKLFEARLDYENRLSGLRASVERINDRLLLDQKSYLRKVDEVKAEFDALAEQQKKMEDFFREGWFPLKPNAASGPVQNPNKEGAAEDLFAKRYAADFKSRSDVVKPLAEMDKSFLTLHNKHLSLLKMAQTFSQKKLDTTTAVLTKLGISPPSPALPLPADAGAMGGPFIGLQEPDRREAEISDGMQGVHGTLVQERRVRSAIAALPLVKPMEQ